MAIYSHTNKNSIKWGIDHYEKNGHRIRRIIGTKKQAEEIHTRMKGFDKYKNIMDEFEKKDKFLENEILKAKALEDIMSDFLFLEQEKMSNKWIQLLPKQSKTVSFPGVYILYTFGNQCLWVGTATNLSKRIYKSYSIIKKKSIKSKIIFDIEELKIIIRIDNYALERLTLEHRLIQILNPIFNRDIKEK